MIFHSRELWPWWGKDEVRNEKGITSLFFQHHTESSYLRRIAQWLSGSRWWRYTWKKENLKIQRKTLSLTYMESTPKHTHITTRQPLQQAPLSLTADYSFSYDECFIFFPYQQASLSQGLEYICPFQPNNIWRPCKMLKHQKSAGPWTNCGFFRHRMHEWIS